MPNRWRNWLAQAEHDLGQATASHLDGRHDWSCFAAHQAAEKAVKALHLALGREAWGHVTARLLNELPTPPPAELIDRARILDNYYVPARYPNGHVEGPAFEHYGSLHSSQALDHARAVIDFVRKALADA
ncbi:MAG: HEPN domain-containing protein [Gemmatimonadota bacterium]|nr:HEPN domain-containing protein [Gemmatimonadota bacterium]